MFVGYLLDFYYRNHSGPHADEELKRVVHFLISNKFIDNQTIRHFTVIAEFHTSIEKQSYKNKTQAVKAIAHKYGLHENTIWNILKDHRHKFGY
ncbi:MAG: hypothetical protein D6730_19060 [Bacteroidetes bacterium]|nr:MAG: hypothetical protein D6730_19060 [Bacteroidota bacterium]